MPELKAGDYGVLIDNPHYLKLMCVPPKFSGAVVIINNVIHDVFGNYYDFTVLSDPNKSSLCCSLSDITSVTSRTNNRELLSILKA